MNYWHDVQPKSDGAVNVITEIPAGSNNKYEIDKETGLIALDRAMHTAQSYPFDYGFVPQTLWDDGDAADVVLLSTYSLHPGILVRVRLVGLMTMIDDDESDDKLIGVPVDDPRWDDVQDIDDVHDHTLREIRHFFRTYKQLQDEDVEIKEFDNRETAQDAFARSRELYEKEYGDN